VTARRARHGDRLVERFFEGLRAQVVGARKTPCFIDENSKSYPLGYVKSQPVRPPILYLGSRVFRPGHSEIRKGGTKPPCAIHYGTSKILVGSCGHLTTLLTKFYPELMSNLRWF
jgi:hypothetical protein